MLIVSIAQLTWTITITATNVVLPTLPKMEFACLAVAIVFHATTL